MIGDRASEAYVHGEGRVCPHCGSLAIRAMRPFIGGEKLTVNRLMKCTCCENHWYEIYALTGVLDAPEKGEVDERWPEARKGE